MYSSLHGKIVFQGNSPLTLIWIQWIDISVTGWILSDN